MAKTCGIYAIVHVSSGKRYVGSSIHVERRLRVHKNELKHNCHHSSHLQNAWNLYGSDEFVFVILEECPGQTEEFLIVREQLHMNQGMEFNILEDSGRGRRRGYKHSEETKEKIRQANKGKKPSDKCLQASKSLEALAKLSKINKGKKPSQAAYDGMKSESARRNRSESQIGHPVSTETKEKLRQRALEQWAKCRKNEVVI